MTFTGRLDKKETFKATKCPLVTKEIHTLINCSIVTIHRIHKTNKE
jgi:hypothetical protein